MIMNMKMTKISHQGKVWDREYQNPKLMTGGEKPQADVLRFFKFLKKEKKFIIEDKDALNFVDNIIRKKCEELKEMEWYRADYEIRIDENNNIEIYSFLNMPDEIRDLLIKIFYAKEK